MTQTVAASPAVERWRQRFALDPVAALEVLLTGRVALGTYDRARPADALLRMLTPDQHAAADQALQTWLADRLGKPLPEGMIAETFADALVEAFRAVVQIPLPQTRAWCAANHGQLRAWLRSFVLDSSRDPESALLVALAHDQTNRNLLILWKGIVRRSTPLEQVRHALLGLRLMPADDQGKTERGFPKALARGLLDFGESLARSGDKKGKPWLAEVDFLAAVYPMSKEQWGRQFREAVQARDVSRDVRHWLDQRYPASLHQTTGRQAMGFLAPPDMTERNALLARLKTDSAGTRAALVALLDRHRHYAQESGDSFYLVRTFCNVGDRLLDFDTAWVRELAHEAARWEPNNHHTWSLLARALEAEGDWRRAEAVYWHARRRFPHNVFAHNQLAHALVLHGQAELGERVYHEAIRLFPDDPVAWADLAHTLRITGRGDKALATYREAQQSFHRNPVIALALTDTLIDLNRLGEAADALAWAEQVAPPDDEKHQRKLEQVRQRLRRAQGGQPINLRELRPPFEGSSGDIHALADITGIDLSDAPALGRIALWRRQGNGGLEKAQTELDALPENAIKLVEMGLLHGANQGWSAAAGWFNTFSERYPGDGVLHVHRQRARARAGEIVDWTFEKAHYIDLLPVILTEEMGKPPRPTFNPNDPDLAEEQRQELWFDGLVSREELPLRDLAEEDFLASRQMLAA
ncbi:MAG: hypothetical protein ACYCTW_06155 [Sulfuricella sp.]